MTGDFDIDVLQEKGDALLAFADKGNNPEQIKATLRRFATSHWPSIIGKSLRIGRRSGQRRLAPANGQRSSARRRCSSGIGCGIIVGDKRSVDRPRRN